MPRTSFAGEHASWPALCSFDTKELVPVPCMVANALSGARCPRVLPRIPLPRTPLNKGERSAEVVLVGCSRSYLFYLLQEVDVRLIGDARPPHRVLQLVGVGEPPGVLHAVPLEEYYELVGVVGIAQDPSSLGAPSLSGRSVVVVEYRLPPIVVLYLVAHKQVRHGVRPLSERAFLTPP